MTDVEEEARASRRRNGGDEINDGARASSKLNRHLAGFPAAPIGATFAA